MKNLAILFLIVSSISFVACDNKTDKELETLNASLMKGHDEVMPKTMMIADIKKKLLAAAENKDEQIKNEALEISTNLQKAEDDMYLWMDNFGKTMNMEDNKEEKLKLYKELDTEVQSLKTLTTSSMESAKAFIAKYGADSLSK